MSILFKGNLEEGNYTLIKSTDGWVLKGEISYAGFNFADRPKGEWIDIGTFETSDKVVIHVLLCQNCGALHRVRKYADGTYQNSKYCPNCGADMRGEEA